MVFLNENILIRNWNLFMCVLVSLSEAVKYFLVGVTIGFVLCCLAFDEQHILDTCII